MSYTGAEGSVHEWLLVFPTFAELIWVASPRQMWLRSSVTLDVIPPRLGSLVRRVAVKAGVADSCDCV